MDPMALRLLEEHLKTKMHYPNVTDLKLIYNQPLTASDVNGDQPRLSMSRNDVLTPFLTQSEDLFLKWKTEDGSNTKIPLNVVVGSTQYKLSLSRWNYHDHRKPNPNNASNSNNSSSNRNKKRKMNNNGDDNDKKRKQNNDEGDNGEQQEKKTMSYGWKYVVNSGWNQLKTENHLQFGDWIKVVSFRSHNHDIGFVLLPTPHRRTVVLALPAAR